MTESALEKITLPNTPADPAKIIAHAFEILCNEKLPQYHKQVIEELRSYAFTDPETFVRALTSQLDLHNLGRAGVVTDSSTFPSTQYVSCVFGRVTQNRSQLQIYTAQQKAV